ncbi:MAG: DJ-1/PfpI/YhbO family deglycase/protease [Methanoculleaceae archaeon]
MKVLVVIAPEKFRDEELNVPIARFREKGIEFDIASTRTGMCTGMLGARVEATHTIAGADPAEYDAICIVGGVGSQDALWNESDLHALVREFAEEGKVVGAICLSPVVLARAGILEGRRATVFPTPASTTEMRRGGAEIVDSEVVSDGKIVTASGPTAAGAFADEFVEKLGC